MALKQQGLVSGRVESLDNRCWARVRTESGELLRVPGAELGEQLLLRPVPSPRGGRVRLARVERVQLASPARVDPCCPQARDCPGCALRHLDYGRQLELKHDMLRQILQRLAGVDPAIVAPPVAHPAPDGRRFRAVATALDAAGELVLGMRALPGSRQSWIDLSRCPAHHDRVNELLSGAAAGLSSLRLRPAVPGDDGAGLVRHVLVHASSDGGGRISLALSRRAAQQHPGGPPALLRELGAGLPGPELCWLVDLLSPRTQATTSGKAQLLRGEPRISFEVGAFRYTARPGAWTPISPQAAELLLQTVLTMLDGWSESDAPCAHPAGSAGSGGLLELGCGVGTLTLPLARQFTRVVGVDGSRTAVLDAQENCARAGVDGVELRVGWAHHAVRRLAAGGERFGTVLLHSIRMPYGPKVLDLLPALGARRLLYASPTPTSLARDLALLTAGGWAVRSVVPVDQIPGTRHVMGVVALERA